MELQEQTAVPAETVPAPTPAEIIAEATNDPQLAKDEFILGGRKFKVVSLGYRQYLQFVSKLEPILKSVAGKVKASFTDTDPKKVHVPGLVLTSLTEIDPSYLLHFCAEELPSMVAIVCNMEKIAAKDATDHVTTDWIEDNAENPFVLIDIVLRQVNKNKMIVQFASFFGQLLPMLLGQMKSPAK